MTKVLHWTFLVIAVWLIVSPWILQFNEVSLAKWSNVVAGLVLALVAVWILFVKNPTKQNEGRTNNNQ